MTRLGSAFNFLLHIQNEEILLVCVIDRCAGDPAQLVLPLWNYIFMQTSHARQMTVRRLPMATQSPTR